MDGGVDDGVAVHSARADPHPGARTREPRRMSAFVRLGHGLYRPASTVDSLPDRIAAYLDVLPPGTVVGGITAARLHGLWLPLPDADERIEFVLTRPQTKARALAGCRRGEIATRRRAVAHDEIEIVDGLPVLSPARTWVDLAERLGLADVVAAGDSALRGPTTAAHLDEALRRARHRRGVLRARAAFDLLDPRSRSRGESHLRCVLVVGGLPWPEVNVPIFTEHGEWLAEPDLTYLLARLALEYNGSAHADVERSRKDITREIDIDQNLWKVVVFGPSQVFAHPYRVVPYVRAMLDERDPGWSRRPPVPRPSLLSGAFGW